MNSDRAEPVFEPIDLAVGDGRSPQEIERLRVTGRRQAVVIATLSEAVSNFHRGLRALRAENAALRAESNELRGRLQTPSHRESRTSDELVEIALERSTRAPSIAREIVVRSLAARVAPRVLDNAQLVMSELVTNSVRHSTAPDGAELVVRVRVWQDRCRLEVEDSGHEGAIAARSPDLVHGHGMGLNLVQAVSERWGLVRAADGPTRVWAQLECGAAPDVASRPNLRAL